METIKDELKERIAGILAMDAGELAVDVPLHTLGLDSMRMVELLVFIETHYGIDLMSAGMQREDIASIDALAASIVRMQG